MAELVDLSDLMTVRAVVDEKKVTKKAVYLAIEENRLRATRIAGRLMVYRSGEGGVEEWQPRAKRRTKAEMQEARGLPGEAGGRE